METMKDKKVIATVEIDGKTYDEKIKNMVSVFDDVLEIFINDKSAWNKIELNAKKMRFTWKKSLDEYYRYLYSFNL